MISRWEQVLVEVIGRSPAVNNLEPIEGSSREPRIGRLLRWIFRTEDDCH